jgi:hypothetical protein
MFLVKTKAKTNSSQANRKAKIPVVIKLGVEIGWF